MRLIWNDKTGGLRMQTLDGSNIELREVFNGVTFRTKEEEALFVCMRDSGFEICYSSGVVGKNFEQRRFRLVSGFVHIDGEDGDSLPEEKYDDEDVAVDITDAPKNRMAAWIAASKIVDRIVEKNPLTGTKKACQAFNTGEPYSAAEQQVDLTVSVANWLLDEGMFDE